jgi:tetratricopeptide (TPR) repeat protein
MTLITIREREGAKDGPNATVSFDRGEEFRITVSDPFSEQEEARLAWYFEEHLRFPFVDQVDAREAAASIARYGEALFGQVFADPEVYARYKEGVRAGLETLCLEVAGTPEFHRLHWEALKDPRLPQPLTLHAPMVRKNLVPQPVQATLRPSPTINLLILTARPRGRLDVGYRTISRPLVEMLRQAELPVLVEILRPGTCQALIQHLAEVRDRHGTGYYHVVHFDVHGALLTYEQLKKGFEANRYQYQERYGREDIRPYDGFKAFLSLEGEVEGKPDLVEAGELAALLIVHQVPIVILNACQSGKQVGARETSLGSRLMQAGAQMVLAMGYSITVSAAELLMSTLYEQLFAGQELPAAIRRARLELYNRRGRRACFDQVIDLEDWLLPVAYQNREVRLTVRDFTAEERAAFFGRQATRYPFPCPAYGFVGRDLDILEIEKCLLSRSNLLLLRGMGGAGKTTLLHYLGAWWQTTGFVDQVFYFGYDERAWTRQQIMEAIARQTFSQADYYTQFQPLGLEAQQAMLAQRLRAHRHLLILDNLESVTGAHLAIRNTLPPEERAALRRFLADLMEGKTLVLLGSRGGEEWLMEEDGRVANPPLRGDDVYELPGLDPEAASTLAERILERHGATRYRQDADLQRLLRLLDGYPLPLEVVLANLARQTPAEVLAALAAGDVALDRGDTQKKTESILRCIDYSHSNLSPDAQGLLACLAPFTSVVNAGLLPQYTEELRQQPALAGLPFARWPEVLREAADWGLLTPDAALPGLLRLQPIFPYFLRSRLQAPEQAAVRSAVEAAFRQHYDDLGGAIADLLQSKEAKEKQLGQALARLEYENLAHALELALEARASILNPYVALSRYLDAAQEQRRGLELGETVLARLGEYPAEALAGPLGAEFVGVLDNIAKCQLLLKRYAAAEASCQKTLGLIAGLRDVDEEMRGKMTASVYHQLGMVAGEQRRWAQAEEYYQQALAIFIEFNDRYFQASTYHQLGMVAGEQRRWAQAEEYYQQALQIYVEFNDRYNQGRVYHQLGRVAQEQRRWAQAEEYYQQALEIKIEFNDRYSQASTYHQLGRVTQEQRRWAQARDYFLQALETFVAYEDSHSTGVVLRSLARLWRESGDAGLPAAVASALGITPGEAEELLRKLLAGE